MKMQMTKNKSFVNKSPIRTRRSISPSDRIVENQKDEMRSQRAINQSLAN